jgi:tol-pal system protein YbgF
MTMKTVRLLALAAAAFAAAGCVSTSDFERAQDQISELQEELANVRRTTAGKEEVQGVNVRIAEQTETLLRSNATLVTKVAEIEERMQNTQGATEQTNYRLDQLAQQLTQTQRDLESLRAAISSLPPSAGGSTGAPSTSEVIVPAPPVSAGNAMETYQAAYRDYQRGNFDLAIEGFREFLQTNPKSELADNAAYWIGESLYSQKKYRDAIEQFDSVVNNFPRSEKVPGALLKKGYAYINVGEKAQGVVQLQYVVHEHPKSQEAPLARQRLKQLGIEPR